MKDFPITETTWARDQPGEPWLDIRLTKDTMDRLWDNINRKQTAQFNHAARQADVKNHITLQQTIKSVYIQDQDNYFYDNVLKQLIEQLYYKDWHNYYNVHVAKSIPPPVFELKELWVNYQKQHEFNPAHTHGGLYSFVVFMKIPVHFREQHSLPWLKGSGDNQVSNFQFLWGHEDGRVQTINFPLCPEDAGRMIIFPAWLHHQVFPFYECEDERITISGNTGYFDSSVQNTKSDTHGK